MRLPVPLVGMMGSGKTSVGKELAGLLGARWIDLDLELERRFRRTVSRQFAVDGEKVFRRREADLLRELAKAGRALVLSTGGGVVLAPENRRLLRRLPTVYLAAPPKVLARRLKQGASKRPLLRGDADALEARLAGLARQRTALYRSCAGLVVRASLGTPLAVARRIQRRLGALG